MKLKYRIKKHTFPVASDVYSAEFKILGIWMNIDSRNLGKFFINDDCECETQQEAYKRIKRHQLAMERAKEWGFKKTYIVQNYE